MTQFCSVITQLITVLVAFTTKIFSLEISSELKTAHNIIPKIHVRHFFASALYAHLRVQYPGVRPRSDQEDRGWPAHLASQ